MKLYKKLHSKKGFTLMELLTVIAIIGILVGLLVPALGKAQTKANEVKIKSNLKQIGYTISLYKMDNHDTCPPNTQALIEQNFISEKDLGELMAIPGVNTTVTYFPPSSDNDDLVILEANYKTKKFSLTRGLRLVEGTSTQIQNP